MRGWTRTAGARALLGIGLIGITCGITVVNEYGIPSAAQWITLTDQ